jgi:hypothetical protein
LAAADIEHLHADDPAQSFQQRFVDGMERLQADTGVDDLGRLYDVELVALDERSAVRLVCFTSFSTALGTPRPPWFCYFSLHDVVCDCR